jgi:predicted PurR-regulated permease PerM
LPRILETWVIGIIAVSALYFARDLFVPLAVALLLSFALSPVVMLLRRWRIGRVPSVITAVVIGFMLLFSIGAIVGAQLAQLAGDLPFYSYNMTLKIETLRGAASSSRIVERVSGMLEQLRKEVTKTAESPSKPSSVPAQTPQRQPTPVEVVPPSSTPLQVIQAIVGPLLQPLATTGIVVVFVIFFLLQREDLRNRFIRLAGARDLSRTTRVLDDAAHRLSRYLLAQSAINTCVGLVVGVGLWLIGVPNPALWGILTILLRFVPYIGPIVAAALPAAVSFAVDPGWSMMMWTVGLFLVVEAFTGQFVEPLIYGKGAGLSPVALIAAAAFWTWLWGPIGLLLSTPLTLCLVVLGSHVDRLEFLRIALSDQPALSPEEAFYQRLLAGDPDEAAHQAEEFLRQETLPVYYDEVAMKGLLLAQNDFNRGVLEHQRMLQIKASMDELLDDLSEHEDRPTEAVKERAAVSDALTASPVERAPTDVVQPEPVLCVAGRSTLDEAAAAMLAQLLEKRRIAARVVPTTAVSSANIVGIPDSKVRIVCVSCLEAGGPTSARFLVRRLRRRLPKVRIVIGFWSLTEEQTRGRNLLEETGADLVVWSLEQAVAGIAKMMVEGDRTLQSLSLHEGSITARQ